MPVPEEDDVACADAVDESDALSTEVPVVVEADGVVVDAASALEEEVLSSS